MSMVGGSVGYSLQRPKDRSPDNEIAHHSQTVNATSLARDCCVITTEMLEYLGTVYRILIKKK
jgi:hypothetical protein